MKKRTVLIGVLVAALGLSSFVALKAHAKPAHRVLYLSSVEAKTPTENAGDEIYLSVTIFDSVEGNKQYTVPDFPIHWPSSSLDQVKNVQLWDGNVVDGASVIVEVTMVEHDAPPLNPDDSVGTVKLRLQNQGGKVSTEWVAGTHTADHTKTNVQQGSADSFTFKGNGGEYQVTFHLTDAPVAMPKDSE